MESSAVHYPRMSNNSLTKYLEATEIPDKDFAKMVGISNAYVSLLKRGHRRPSVKLARRIHALTGIPFERLLSLDENTKIRKFVSK
jgi:transcriptional regulator with XRE-family HTH domain